MAGNNEQKLVVTRCGCRFHPFIPEVIIVSLGFWGVFSAFSATKALQTSEHGEEGYIALATLYYAFSVAALFSAALVSAIGPRASLVAGGIPYFLFVFSNLYPTPYLHIPAAGCVGIGAALLWNGQGVYVARCALHSARLQQISNEKATSAFSGLFYSLFQFTGFLGCLASGTLLLLLSNADSASSESARHTLFLVLGFIGVGGVVIFCFLPRVEAFTANEAPPTIAAEQGEREGTTPPHVTVELAPANASDGPIDSQQSASEPSTEEADALEDTRPLQSDAATAQEQREALPLGFWQKLCRVLSLCGRDRRMSMVAVLIFFNGFSLGFLFGKYYGTFAARLLGKDYTTFVAACFFFGNAVASYLSGNLAATRLGRSGLMALGLSIEFIFFVLCAAIGTPALADAPTTPHFSWGTMLALGIGAVVYGTGDAVLKSQAPAILATFFTEKDEQSTAMANAKLWQSLGFAAAFTTGPVMTLWVQSLVTLALWLLASASMWYLHRRVASIDSSTAPSRP